ncbi:MAG: DUF86 domain-containing protein [Candidatus Brocadiaceae bacterium]|nr:DUF86 domain-containing protein [Candidatus Brocadiaceae bacterium]
MSKRRDIDYLGDIKEAIELVTAYTQGLTFGGFIQDRKTQDAVIRNLEIIGEATKNISAHLRKKYPQVPWKEFAGLRDKVIHHYFGIKHDVIWQVKEELPEIIPQIKEIMNKEV